MDSKQYYQNNKHKYKEYNKRYYIKNYDKINQYKTEYYKQYREKNRDEYNEYYRQYRLKKLSKVISGSKAPQREATNVKPTTEGTTIQKKIDIIKITHSTPNNKIIVYFE